MNWVHNTRCLYARAWVRFVADLDDKFPHVSYGRDAKAIMKNISYKDTDQVLKQRPAHLQRIFLSNMSTFTCYYIYAYARVAHTDWLLPDGFTRNSR